MTTRFNMFITNALSTITHYFTFKASCPKLTNSGQTLADSKINDLGENLRGIKYCNVNCIDIRTVYC